jgi:hypothetical protein
MEESAIRDKEEKGRKRFYTRAMTVSEKMKLGRMRNKAEVLGLPIEELERYSIFAPELEARAFVDKLVENNGEVVKTMRQLYPTLKQQGAVYVMKKGLELCEALRVKELIKEALDKKSISVESIVSKILEISKSAKRDSDKLRALELLGKFKNMFNDGMGGNKVEYNLNISEDAARRLLERRTRYDIGQAGRFNGGSTCDVINGEEVVDGLCDSDAERLQTELASRDNGEEVGGRGIGEDEEVDVVHASEAREDGNSDS